jgi:hypothetical protein
MYPSELEFESRPGNLNRGARIRIVAEQFKPRRQNSNRRRAI